MVLKLQPRQIPQNPGVYFFRNKRGKIIYIGKAGNLRARLASYFAKTVSSKTGSLLTEADALDWEIVNSEAEALIREAELIKKLRPKYNVLMRDDKNYFYVGFSKELYPKIFITHQPVGRTEFIGPFTEGSPLKSVLKLLRRTFPYCTCKSLHDTLCLNGKIGRCIGYCCLKNQRPEKATDYKKNIEAIKKILSGKNRVLTRLLKKEMQVLSNAQKYEEAGKNRNQIWALEKIFDHREVIKRDLPSDYAKALRALEAILGIEDIKRIEAYDIANIGGQFAYGSMAVLEDGAIKKDNYRIFKIRSVTGSDDSAMLREVLTRRFKHPEWKFPQVIIVDGGKPQMSAAKEAQKLSSKDLLPHSGFLALHPIYGGSDTHPKSARGRNDNFYPKVSEPPKIIALTKNKKHVGDHIFLSGQRNPLSLESLPPSLKNLIQHLDSEAHRFAIRHYRDSHKKSLLT